MTPEIAARLESSGILMAAETRDYCLFARGDCLALVQTSVQGFLSIGSSGILTEKGLSYLTWSDGKAWLSAHGSRIEASAGQVEAIRGFSEDLKSALGLDQEKEPGGRLIP